MGFDEILGQGRAVGLLKQAMKRGRIPHAFLFAGPPGVGKTLTARALCKALNCHHSVGEDSCGRCVACRQMESGNFPDFSFLEPDGQNIKIDQIREQISTLGYPPHSGRYRIVLIARAEAFTIEAANAFLKTLEEPPPGNVLILESNQPRDLLPTIVSRCQRIPFQPLERDTIAGELEQRLKLGAETAAILAAYARGSLGLALQLGQSDFIAARETWLQLLGELCGAESPDLMAMGKRLAAQVSQKPEPLSLSGIMEIWKGWCRDLLLVKARAPEHLLFNQDYSRKLKSTADKITIHNLARAVEALDRAQQDLQRNRNTAVVTSNLALYLRRHLGSAATGVSGTVWH